MESLLIEGNTVVVASILLGARFRTAVNDFSGDPITRLKSAYRMDRDIPCRRGCVNRALAPGADAALPDAVQRVAQLANAVLDDGGAAACAMRITTAGADAPTGSGHSRRPGFPPLHPRAGFHYPIAPVVVGFIVGPMAELPLHRALQNSRGDPMILFSSPISITLLAITVLIVAVPLVLPQMGRGRILAQLAAEED
jgi:hypothetical protein